MALDYSKLSDEELEAIANNDYSKLSDATLKAIASDSSEMPSLAPQSVATAKNLPYREMAQGVTQGLIPAAKDVAQGVYNVGKSVLSYPIDVAKNAMTWTPRSIYEVATHPVATARQYIEAHPIMQSNASLKSVAKDVGQYAKNIGSRLPSMSSLGAAALAPESVMALPYQMAGMEMERIRANPTAPEYATNPYGQVVRGEAPTMGAAGAANRRQAIAGQQYGGLTAEQQAMLEQDKIDQAIRRKAASKVLGPIAPGQ